MMMYQNEHGHEGMFIDQEVITSTGEKLGRVERTLPNRVTEVPEWLVVHSGILGLRHHIVPVAGCEVRGDQILIPYTDEEVASAPAQENHDELSEDAEELLNQHFRLGA